MSDMISKDKLMKSIKENVIGASDFTKEIMKDFIDIVERQPVELNMEKVIKDIENKTFSAELYGDCWNGEKFDNLICFGDIVDILDK